MYYPKAQILLELHFFWFSFPNLLPDSTDFKKKYSIDANLDASLRSF